eukprot:11182718-Lingulodinium_polyedra.AAC.1
MQVNASQCEAIQINGNQCEAMQINANQSRRSILKPQPMRRLLGFVSTSGLPVSIRARSAVPTMAGRWLGDV